MNKLQHRLVFSRRLGMRVAAPEHARAAGKSAGGETRRRLGAPRWLAALAGAGLALAVAAQAPPPARPPVVFASKLPAPKHALPQPYGTVRNADGSLRNDPARRSFVANPALAGRVSWTVDGQTATFNQGSVERVVLNWDSFDIAPGHKVHFAQDKDPAKYVSALNRIWSADPSVILGSLSADREVILLNANGVYFGRGARVDTGKFVATSLAIADSVFEKGLRNITDGSAAFTGAGTDYLPTNLDSAISVEAGAEIRSAAGGDVLLIAPRVVNQGRIETPRGQTVLAAGDKVYLMSSSDPAQRGLIVAVDPVGLAGGGGPDPTLGLAENSASGSFKTVAGATVPDTTPDNTTGLVERINEIRAESGTVNLVGLSVRQAGQVNATTAVKGANGAIYLQAMAGTTALVGGLGATTPTSRRGLLVEAGGLARVGTGGGTVEIGRGSETTVRPSGSQTQIDAEVFNPSRIRVEGGAIVVEDGARIDAPAGRVELLAALNTTTSVLFDSAVTTVSAQPDASRIVIAPGAQISVAGLRDVAVDGARNQGAQRLFRIELADDPVQRDGPLYRQEVFFDLRDAAKITVADVSGAAKAIGRTADERSTAGGSLRIEGEGAVVVGAGAMLDVSGGSVAYSATTLKSSLVEREGRVFQLRGASGANRLDALGASTALTAVPAYTEGASGGDLTLGGRTLAVAGDLVGQVIQGERQRDGSAARAAAATLNLGRQTGANYYLTGITLQAGEPVGIDPSIFLQPFGAALDALPASTLLSLAGLTDPAEGGFGALVLRAGDVAQAGFASVDFGPLGKLDVRAGRIALDGEFIAPGGSVALSTTQVDLGTADNNVGDIALSGRSRLDTAGRWTNHSPGGDGAATPIQTRGGTVSVSAARSLRAEPGAVIDVSGGAHLSASGSLSRGTAGTMSLATGRSDQFVAELALEGATLRGVDFSAGGSLALGTPDLTVGTPASAGGFSLQPGFFSANGFGSIAINAYGDVTLRSGTLLAPVLQNWLLSADHRNRPSGAMASVASTAPVDPALAERAPVSLSLAATPPLNPGQGLPGGNLVVERGATIQLEPGARLSLSATRNLEIGVQGGQAGQAAALVAPGGQMTLAITGQRGAASAASAGDDPAGFLGDQALWLGHDARLSVSGTAQLRRDGRAPTLVTFHPDPTTASATPGDERVTGRVLGGGSLTLEAQRGYVVAEPGSSMQLDGAQASLNLPGLAAAVTVARPAGTLKVSSAEGIVLDGTVSAQAPRDTAGRPLADGGRLEVSIGLGGVNTFTAGPAYPGSPPAAVPKPRQLVLLGAQDPVVSAGLQPGDDLSLALDNGIAYLTASLPAAAGFDALRLGAGDRIRFDTAIDLHMPRGVVLDAPALQAAPGVQVALGGAYASFGDRSISRIGAAPDRTATVDASTGPATTLTLRAPTIEVVGASALQGFGNVTLDAGGAPDGEVRLSAVAPSLSSLAGAGEGRLAFASVLALTAAQIYTTTASRFSLQGLPAGSDSDAGSHLVLGTGASGAASRQPLSSFGTLSASATQIDHHGVLRQPFGAIELNAERELQLGDRSITSVSGAGLSHLYGATDNLTQWLLPNGQYSSTLPVDKGIRLNAGHLVTSASAQVDARGGGDVLAWEFFAGVGGSQDPLASDGLYAVLPDHAATAAIALNGGVLGLDGPGKQLVVTMAGSGLAPGAYTLLPARLALMGGTLPNGAFIVQRAPDNGKAVLGAPQVLDDGSVVISGHLRDIGASHAGVPGERFIVASAPVFAARGEIRLSSVSTLFAAGAETLGLAESPATPRDGGQVRVTTTGEQASVWRAGLSLGADGGRAGLLDVSAQRIALVDDLAKAPDGALTLSAASIVGSQAGSVLLGGLRQAGAPAADGTPTFQVDAGGTRSVTVDSGTALQAVEELILAASDSVDIAKGSQIGARADGTLGARNLSTDGPGALLAVSANPLEIRRRGATTESGRLTVAPDTRLSGASVALDATAALHIDPGTRLQADGLALAARRIMVGDGDPDDLLATRLTGNLLASARESASLSLRSYSSIDFIGEQNWAARPPASATEPEPGPGAVQRHVVLDAPLLRGLAAPDGSAATADLAAQSVLVRNTTGQIAATDAIGQGRLTLQALPPLQYGHTGGLTLGPGDVRLAFDQVQLRSGGDIVLDGTGSIAAQRDLSLQSARLSATTGAEQALSAANGTLRIAHGAGERTLGERVGQGASVTLSAQTVQQAGRIDLAGGRLSIKATGDGAGAGSAVVFEPGSITSVAGFAVADADGFEVFGQAGRIDVDAARGAIDVLGTLDMSAARRADGSAGQGDAGKLVLHASGTGGALRLQEVRADGTVTGGRLLGQAGSGGSDRGGQIDVDVDTMSSLDDLALAAAAGGIDRSVTLRVRHGHATLAQDLVAQRMAIGIDDGALSIEGKAQLRALAPAGGVVELAAGGDVSLAAGTRVEARSSRAGAQGGDVLLTSASGRVRINGDARIDAGGDDAADGRIVLRALRGADGRSVQVDVADTTRLQAGEVDIEAVRVYRQIDASGIRRDITTIAAGNSVLGPGGGTLGQATVRNDNAQFIGGAAAVLDALGVSGAERDRIHLRAGVEVQAAGDLTVSGDWGLQGDRPGGDGGFLTLRAAGNLTLNGSLSDGFTSAATSATLSNADRAWSLRLAAGAALAAGADPAAASPMAVADLSAAAAGDLTIGAGRLVRTGAGSIELAAGRDIRFSAGSGTTAPGTVYVAGRAREDQAEVLATLFAEQAAKPSFTERGGRLELQAQRDIDAAASGQLVNNWLWRSGLPGTREEEQGQYATGSQLGWWTEFSRFRQSAGAFGGGGLLASAGRDIVNLQAMVPTAGWADSAVIAQAQVQRTGGGDLTVSAGRDLLGGQYLVGVGEGRLDAGGTIGASEAGIGQRLPLLAQMDGGRWQVQARQDLSLVGSFNPTAVPTGTADSRPAQSGFFYSWGDDASLTLRSHAGDLSLAGGLTGSQIALAGLVGGAESPNYFRVLPASLHASALGGDLRLLSDEATGALLFPSATGQLALWADGAITLGGDANTPNFAMADSDPAAWPSARSPATRSAGQIAGQNGLVATTLADSQPRQAVHAADAEPARLRAGTSLSMQGDATLLMAKSTRISAGEDVLNLRLVGQNLTADDLTLVSAGRNVLAGAQGQVTIGGPGALVVSAGRELDLGASLGISTTGNQRNARLPAGGASIRISAATAGTLDLAAFSSTYLSPDASGIGDRWQSYRSALTDFVRSELASPDLSFDEAWRRFQGFPSQVQTAFGQQVLASEFGARYLELTPDQEVQLSASLEASLRQGFERHRTGLIDATTLALEGSATTSAAPSADATLIVLPGGDALDRAETEAFRDQMRALSFDQLALDPVLEARTAQLLAVNQGWRDAVAGSLGGTAAGFDALAAQQPQDPAVLAYQAALQARSGRLFEAYRQQVLASETAGAGNEASQFGRSVLPMRMALYDQGFAVAELARAGSFAATSAWSGSVPVIDYRGALAMTQSSVVTERGGDISLVNAGGAINVGLKELPAGSTNTAKGVIALGGGDIYGFAKNDFQVNTQRVFIVGQGDMVIWSSLGDIDSGRGSNTAVAAPPLVARRSVDGMVFEVPATTAGSGLGILADANGQLSGSIGLFPAFGEIRALDAFIRAPSVVLGSTVQGADNLITASLGGAAGTVTPPPPVVSAPPPVTDGTAAESLAAAQTATQRTRNSLLTVELLGLGAAPPEEACTEEDAKAGKCTVPPKPCSAEAKASGQCR